MATRKRIGATCAALATLTLGAALAACSGSSAPTPAHSATRTAHSATVSAPAAKTASPAPAATSYLTGEVCEYLGNQVIVTVSRLTAGTSCSANAPMLAKILGDPTITTGIMMGPIEIRTFEASNQGNAECQVFATGDPQPYPVVSVWPQTPDGSAGYALGDCNSLNSYGVSA